MNEPSLDLLKKIGRGQESFWHVTRRYFVESLLRDNLREKFGLTFLEVGCGLGYEMVYFQNKYRFDTYGIDIEQNALKFCKENINTKLCQASAENLPFIDRQFDVLLSLDVIEHIDDDIMALKEFYRVCKKDAIIIVSVPANIRLWSKFDEIVMHKRRYSKVELEAKIKKVGFEIQRISYIFFSFLPILVVLRFIDKLKFYVLRDRDSINNELIKPPYAINFLISQFLKPELFLFSRNINFLIGSSLICTAKKPF